MNSWIERYKEKLLQFWQPLERRQRIMLIATVIFLVASLSIYAVLASRTKYELAFVNLSEKEAGSVVKKLEEMGITYELTAGGKNVSVPESQVNKVKVSMAEEEVISSGNYAVKAFENSPVGGFTDDQFKVIERGAIEQELRQLIVDGIRGINDAKVMITLPKESVFINQDKKATASVVVDIEPGVILSPKQIKSMYKIISLSIPDLPIENITVANQYMEPLEYIDNDNAGNLNLSSYDQQREIQNQYQLDIKNKLEQMLGMMFGPGHVIVNVQASMNFDQEMTESKTYEPVVDDKGIARSVEKIQESFSGADNPSGGVTGTGSSQIPGYPSGSSTNGDFEHLEERVNYEVNEISQKVVRSPYYLKDIGVNVVVDVDDQDPKTKQTTDAIQDLIKPIVSAALSGQELSDDSVKQKIVVVAHPFEAKESIFGDTNGANARTSPLLYYGLIGLAILAVGGISFGVVGRKRKQTKEEEMSQVATEEPRKMPEFDMTPVLTEEAALRKEIQKMVKQKPDEFVKLVRTWIADE